MNKIIALAPICCVLATAQAHVVLENQTAPAASSYKAVFKVGHGCGNSPTRQLIVDIPAAMQAARPMPKPGWRIDVEKTGDKVIRVTWTAKTPEDKLPDGFYDEFVLVARAPAEPGRVYWPVGQVCDEGRADWVEVPGPEQKLSDLKAPAALLEITPAGSAAVHKH
jgi:periplasmic copper chaperone A